MALRLLWVTAMSSTVLVSMVASAYTIVKVDGGKIEAQDPPEFRDGRAYYRIRGTYKLLSLPENQLDKEATAAANPTATPSATTPPVTPETPTIYTLILKDGRRLESFGRPELRDDRWQIRLKTGVLIRVSKPDVDEAATLAANPGHYQTNRRGLGDVATGGKTGGKLSMASDKAKYVVMGYLVIRRDGASFEAKTPPEFVEGVAIITLPGGSTIRVPEAEIDKVATASANANKPGGPPSGVVSNETLASRKTSPDNPELPSMRAMRLIQEERGTFQRLCANGEAPEPSARSRFSGLLKLHIDELSDPDVLTLSQELGLLGDPSDNDARRRSAYFQRDRRQELPALRSQIETALLSEADCKGAAPKAAKPSTPVPLVSCIRLDAVTTTEQFRRDRYMLVPTIAAGGEHVTVKFRLCAGEDPLTACKTCGKVFGVSYKTVKCLAFESQDILDASKYSSAHEACWRAMYSRTSDGHEEEAVAPTPALPSSPCR